jgi:hypothetical protein
MHKINVLAFGPQNFNTSLAELKDHLNFKLVVTNNIINSDLIENCDILFIHQDFLKDSISNDFLLSTKKIKILASYNNKIKSDNFTDSIHLPTSVKNINQIIEKSIVKELFSVNSSIKIKNYILDKNEKKLTLNEKYVLLTEKEIQLLELFLNNKSPVNKELILSKVWKYSNDADTHTVETHIYRLRKKIKDTFLDENFILNNKDGYLL